MTINQILFFGADSAPEDFRAWCSIRFADGEIAYRLESGPLDGLAAQPFANALSILKHEVSSTAGICVAIRRGPHSEPMLTMHVNQGKRVSAPRALMRLTFNGVHEWKKLESGDSPLAEWDAIVVPVSANCEKPLDAFTRAAADLPPTTRSTVFLQLALPSLESRVARIEQMEEFARLSKGLQGYASAGRRSPFELSNLPAVAASAVLVLVSLLQVLIVFRLGSIEDQLAPAARTLIEGPAVEGPRASRPASDSLVSRRLPGRTSVALVPASVEDRLLDALTTGRAGTFTLDSVNFKGLELDDSAETVYQLSTIATILLAFAPSQVEVSAGADGAGSAAGPRRRADAVRRRLIELGVPEHQVTAGALGRENAQGRHATLKIVMSDPH